MHAQTKLMQISRSIQNLPVLWFFFFYLSILSLIDFRRCRNLAAHFFSRPVNNIRMGFQITNGACANVSNRIKEGEFRLALPHQVSINSRWRPRRNSLRDLATIGGYRGAGTRATGVFKKMWQTRKELG